MFVSERWKPRRRTRMTRGFTMIEMMVVVAVVGILATLAVFGVRRYINSAKTSEAMAMVNSIRAAEESYRDETFRYLGQTGYAGAVWHPTLTPSGRKHNWATGGTANTMTNMFRELGVETNNPVYYTYTVVAGGAGTAVPAPPCGSFSFPIPQEPYYVVVARGDVDDDRQESCVVSHSFSSEIYVENEGE